MQLEVLNNFLGDGEMDLNTDTEEGRQKVAEALNKLFKSGTAIFLERAQETYRVTGYDPHTDKLIVQVPDDSPAQAQPEEEAEAPEDESDRSPCVCNGCEDCPNTVRSTSKTGKCSQCQQGRHGGKKTAAKSRRGIRYHKHDRVTAVAPRAGG